MAAVIQGVALGTPVPVTFVAGGLPFHVLVVNAADVALGTLANAWRIDPTGATTQPVSGTVTANQGTANVTPWNENISQWGGVATTLGQKAMAASVPVVIASDQSAVPISAASLPLPAGAATEATLATRLAEATFTARINTPGQKVMASSTPVVIASDQSAVPVSGTVTSNIGTTGGLLLDATFTGRINTLGQKTMAASTPVVIASDQSAVPVSGTVAVSSITTSVTPGTAAANLGKAEDGLHTSGDVGVMALGVSNQANTALAADGDYVPFTTDTEGSGRTIGNRAHDAVDAGNPIKVGGIARQANQAAVAGLDRVDATFDDLGRQVVVLNQVRDLEVHQQTTIVSSAAETTILAAGAAGVFHDLVSLDLTNRTATAVTVTIKDATAGTTRLIYSLAASGGMVKIWLVPMNQAVAANNWTATLSVATVTVDINTQAVKNV